MANTILRGEIGQWLVVLMILKKRTGNELKGG